MKILWSARAACAGAAMLWLCVSGGCVSEVEPAPDPIAEKAASGEAEGFDTIEDLLAFLKGMSTADDRVEMMNLMWSRSLSDMGTKNAAQELIEAQRDYVAAVAEHFDGAASSVLDADLGIAAYAAAMDDARITDISSSRKAIDFTDDLGQERRLLAVQVLGKWRLHARSIKNGEELVQVWYHPTQGRLRAMARRYNDVTQDIKDGEITSVAEADARIREIIGDDQVLYGGLTYLTIDAQIDPEREEPEANVRSG